MMKRILVPLDGSLLAERALAVAAMLARSTNGRLILVQAVTLPAEYDSLLVPGVSPLAYEENIRAAQAYLTSRSDLPVLSGLTVETRVWEETPALSILNAATECRADMIVMTSHGRTGLSHWVFGSVAEHVARQAEVPVLILRQRQLSFWLEEAAWNEGRLATASSGPIPPLRVLVPLDGSPVAEAALPIAAGCATALARGATPATGLAGPAGKCQLRLVLVVRPIDTVPENKPEALLVSSAARYLADTASQLQESYPHVAVTSEVITSGDVAAAIIEILEGEQEYSLLAMATHGRAGIIRWVWGSVTERVVQKTQLPVLLIRPR